LKEDIIMPKNGIKINSFFTKLRNPAIERDIRPYECRLQEVNRIALGALSDSELQNMAFELRDRIKAGAPQRVAAIEAFALAREASDRVLDMRPFDVQVIAGMAMCDGRLVEMQTGEGKTLAAVFPAFFKALSGKGTHVLTVNDYLAGRDAAWMGPVYEFLGLTVGYVKEGMGNAERKRAYGKDITYLTAKEAGFDFLRGFLALSKEELVQRPFQFAIIDEADSILIDEARIPLVIAGSGEASGVDTGLMARIVESLRPHEDYDSDEQCRNAYLTESGVCRVEAVLQCDNLYEEKNLQLLVGLNNALHAEVLLKRDIDYIVRRGKIELIDEFTGRIADKRNWPHGLQEAIEAKEGIVSQSKGQILASITMQHFIRQYPAICGMTGTAISSANEFLEKYGLNVVVVPTNRSCIRVDYPDIVFENKVAKEESLTAEIIRVHKTGQPILIGTCSIEESERLASKLLESEIECHILNAKNDELEAHIIAEAGAVGAVTVSTNMAGRGTDIKLGGSEEQDHERVAGLGGLYVIGTNRNASLRIDRQLRGRAGRQGDPGFTRFFVSLEDELFKQYRIGDGLRSMLCSEACDSLIDNPMFRKEIAHAQRVVEGQNTAIRSTLNKYNEILEQQRRSIFNRRLDVLLDREPLKLMAERLCERYNMLCELLGEAALQKAEKQVTLHFINSCWADYIDYISYIRESIHLTHLAGKNPIYEFNRLAFDAFERLLEDIEDSIINTLSHAEVTKEGIDMKKEGLEVPASTWTYLVDDGMEQLGLNALCRDPLSAALQLPLFMVLLLSNRYLRKRENIKD
jgi:preprotein translocase subunit SecA